jgi:hypothetical protein
MDAGRLDNGDELSAFPSRRPEQFRKGKVIGGRV